MAASPGKTPISLLQEYGTRLGRTPGYDLLKAEGQAHQPNFTFRVTLGDISCTGGTPNPSPRRDPPRHPQGSPLCFGRGAQRGIPKILGAAGGPWGPCEVGRGPRGVPWVSPDPPCPPGQGPSKKAAKHKAAEVALRLLRGGAAMLEPLEHRWGSGGAPRASGGAGGAQGWGALRFGGFGRGMHSEEFGDTRRGLGDPVGFGGVW